MLATDVQKQHHTYMTDMHGDRIYDSASELGVSREEGESRADFLKRFGRFVTQRYDINDKGAGEIIAALRLEDYDDPSVRELLSAARLGQLANQQTPNESQQGKYTRTFEFVPLSERRGRNEAAEAQVFWEDFDGIHEADFVDFLQIAPVGLLDGVARHDLSDQAKALDAAIADYSHHHKDDSYIRGIGIGVGLRNFAAKSSPQLRREQLVSASEALKQMSRDFDELPEKAKKELWLVDGLLSEAVAIATTQMIDDSRRTYELLEEATRYSRPAANQIRRVGQSYLMALESRLQQTDGRVPRLSASSMSRLAQAMIFRQTERLLTADESRD